MKLVHNAVMYFCSFSGADASIVTIDDSNAPTYVVIIPQPADTTFTCSVTDSNGLQASATIAVEVVSREYRYK